MDKSRVVYMFGVLCQVAILVTAIVLEAIRMTLSICSLAERISSTSQVFMKGS